MKEYKESDGIFGNMLFVKMVSQNYLFDINLLKWPRYYNTIFLFLASCRQNMIAKKVVRYGLCLFWVLFK
jgi:hypothetical protein